MKKGLGPPRPLSGSANAYYRSRVRCIPSRSPRVSSAFSRQRSAPVLARRPRPGGATGARPGEFVIAGDRTIMTRFFPRPWHSRALNHDLAEFYNAVRTCGVWCGECTGPIQPARSERENILVNGQTARRGSITRVYTLPGRAKLGISVKYSMAMAKKLACG